jgi:DMSO/TMAO reductase YedYZ molybdopterin-dependent catalytic subunit
MPPRKPPFISEETVSRRSLIEWFGKASVLALGADLLAGCMSTRPVMVRLDAGSGGPDAGTGPDDDPAGGNFPFQPGGTDKEIFSAWGERTVDGQDLEDILAGWRLKVDGLVESPAVLTFADLIQLPRRDQVTDFHCVEGWSVYDVPWNGVHLSQIFSIVRPKAAATHVAFHTIGGEYNDSLPGAVALEPKTILAYGIDGSTLPLKHGFPLRVVVPRLLGYKNAKYVERIELTDEPLYGFWVKYGYPYEGEVPAGRLREGKY